MKSEHIKIRYFIKAFLFHWNLLFVGGGAAAGLISGYPDIIIPLIAGIEVLYLAVVATRPRFQATIDLAERKKIVAAAALSPQVEHILSTLNAGDRSRYHQLRKQIHKLRHISWGVQDGDSSADFSGVTDVAIEGINRLLGIYLKLLYSKNRLESFFENTDAEAIRADIKRARARLKDLGADKSKDLSKAKHREALEDTLKTSHQRIKNFQSAKENYDFIGLEVQRLHSKIAGLVEMGINRHQPELISSEINSVADSIRKTEGALSELELIDELSTLQEIGNAF
ncbi:hypothetical protein QUF90_18090 [Desulfococcaceae bacterium HSG9]|nr:hypothetical protein [Desulfococcaceae bacterium HSG9]